MKLKSILVLTLNLNLILILCACQEQNGAQGTGAETIVTNNGGSNVIASLQHLKYSSFNELNKDINLTHIMVKKLKAGAEWNGETLAKENLLIYFSDVPLNCSMDTSSGVDFMAVNNINEGFVTRFIMEADRINTDLNFSDRAGIQYKYVENSEIYAYKVSFNNSFDPMLTLNQVGTELSGNVDLHYVENATFIGESWEATIQGDFKITSICP